MKTGDKVVCPHCGESAFAKSIVEMDGWTPKGRIFVCPLCGGKLADDTPEHAKSHTSSKSASFASFLGAEDTPKPTLSLAPEDRKFCRDCRFFLVHPFHSHCEKHPEQTDPMSDCPDFLRSSTEQSDAAKKLF